MSKKRCSQMIRLGIEHFKDPYYHGFAAELAFYFLLSIVPTMIVLSQILGLFSVSLDALREWINMYVSEDVTGILEDFISYSPTGAMNVFLIATALWSASRAQFSLMRIANYTLSAGQYTGRGYIRDRVRAIRTIVLTLFTVTFALLILVHGEAILHLVMSTVTRTLRLGYEPKAFWLFIRWPVALALYFLMVSYNYYVLPYERVRFKKILPGSIFASIAMMVVTLVYSQYMKYVANYDIIYGSLASVVALLFWFFFLAWTLWLGVLLNKVLDDTREMV